MTFSHACFFHLIKCSEVISFHLIRVILILDAVMQKNEINLFEDMEDELGENNNELDEPGLNEGDELNEDELNEDDIKLIFHHMNFDIIFNVN